MGVTKFDTNWGSWCGLYWFLVAVVEWVPLNYGSKSILVVAWHREGIRDALS